MRFLPIQTFLENKKKEFLLQLFDFSPFSPTEGSSWRIHMSEQTRDLLEKAGRYHIEPRGSIEIKGKGLMNTYWLLGKKGFDKILPTPPPIG